MCPVRVAEKPGEFVVVQPGALERTVLPAKAERFDEMQLTSVLAGRMTLPVGFPAGMGTTAVKLESLCFLRTPGLEQKAGRSSDNGILPVGGGIRP